VRASFAAFAAVIAVAVGLLLEFCKVFHRVESSRVSRAQCLRSEYRAGNRLAREEGFRYPPPGRSSYALVTRGHPFRRRLSLDDSPPGPPQRPLFNSFATLA